MTHTNNTTGKRKWLMLITISAILLLIAFFLPWVSWGANNIKGYYMPSGDFFSISKKEFGEGNPFPQFDFAVFVFWLIPALTVITIFLRPGSRVSGFTGVLAGMLALVLATIYFLFSRTMAENFGIGSTLFKALKPGIYLTVIAAIGLIIASLGKALWIKKLGFIIIAPALAWLGFLMVADSIENKEHGDTDNIKAVYTVNGQDLIKEFLANDSAANAKYREKIITVNGRITEKQLPNDSTVNIKISDATGSYLIFPLLEPYLADAKKLNTGDSVSLKGSCSGGIYSEILSTEFISFKRCIINK